MLYLFKTLEESKESSTRKSHSPDKKENRRKKDINWSTTATMAERIREQTHMSLTERLRQEFGLDTLGDDDVNGNTDEPCESPPPPPPPPPPPASRFPAASAMVSTPESSVFIAPGQLPPPPVPLPAAGAANSGPHSIVQQHNSHIPPQMYVLNNTSHPPSKKGLLPTPLVQKGTLLPAPPQPLSSVQTSPQGYPVTQDSLLSSSSKMALPSCIPPANILHTQPIGSSFQSMKVESSQLQHNSVPSLIDVNKMSSYSNNYESKYFF